MRAALLALLLAAPAAADEADSLLGAPAPAPAAAAPPLRKLAEPPKDAPVLEPRGPAQAPAAAPLPGLERREGAEKDRVRPDGTQPPADAGLPRKTRAPTLKPAAKR
jgi:hypothetical protein